MKNLDNDQLIMLEIQAELFDLLTKHADSMSQAVAITFKTVVDCYVAQFGRDGAENMLKTAIHLIYERYMGLLKIQKLKRAAYS